MRENRCKVPIGKGRIGTNEGNPKQSAYKKKKSRHARRKTEAECLQIEKTVGTQEGKLKQDAYRKKHPTERTT